MSQWECGIRVTTRPGEEGVPRWSSLEGVREGVGMGNGRKRVIYLPSLDIDLLANTLICMISYIQQ